MKNSVQFNTTASESKIPCCLIRLGVVVYEYFQMYVKKMHVKSAKMHVNDYRNVSFTIYQFSTLFRNFHRTYAQICLE